MRKLDWLKNPRLFQVVFTDTIVATASVPADTQRDALQKVLEVGVFNPTLVMAIRRVRPVRTRKELRRLLRGRAGR